MKKFFLILLVIFCNKYYLGLKDFLFFLFFPDRQTFLINNLIENFKNFDRYNFLDFQTYLLKVL